MKKSIITLFAVVAMASVSSAQTGPKSKVPPVKKDCKGCCVNCGPGNKDDVGTNQYPAPPQLTEAYQGTFI